MRRRDFSWDCADCGFNGQLQQGFTIGGMGPDCHFARQQSLGPNVRFGSEADISHRPINVRFALKSELRGTGVTITTLCPGATTSEFAQVANMQGSAIFEGPTPVMTAAEVARQGYAALKAGRPQIITGLVNRIIAMSTRFTPTAILLMIAGHINRPGSGKT